MDAERPADLAGRFCLRQIKKEKPMLFCMGFLMRRKGFEPPTYWFVASYSIQLSYRRI